MNIAGMRVRIIIQKNATIVDEIGNHKSIWKDYFSCWATASESTGKEDTEAAHTDETESLYLTVRYCSETASVTAKGCRIILDHKIYNITHVNMMGWRHHSIKFTCSLVSHDKETNAS